MQEQNRDKNRLRFDLPKSGQDIDSSCNIKDNRAENEINGENPIKNWLHIDLRQLLDKCRYQVKDGATQLA